ncbi:MAG TPA: Xaa-Pro peptidase family protein [Bacillota bacterium]|nr:Xaa-Pro peptidase family protein [Bacillota bacterium]
MAHRLSSLRTVMQDRGLEALLIISPENRRYISGFTGSSAYLLITQTQAWLLTDFRYVEQAKSQTDGFQVIQHGAKWEERLKELVLESGIKEIGFEQNFVTFGMHTVLSQQLAPVRLLPQDNLVESLRMVKDAGELELIRQAVEIADRGFNHILEFIEPGKSEKEVAVELEFCLRRLGAEKAAFDFIIASGTHSALPHAEPRDCLIEQGRQLKMDFGAVVKGYHSDITRTVFLGQATEKFREIYYTVLEAQERAIAAIAPGKLGREVDQVARDYITAQGYGEFFGHGLGHAVGLNIHEEPRLSIQGEVVLEPGMVVTVEPGIYLPDWGGVRIEDIVVVTPAGCEILTKAPKALIEL